MDITIPPGETATIYLPGSAAIRIDSRHRVIAVDTVSVTRGDMNDLYALNAAVLDSRAPGWLVQDLREGIPADPRPFGYAGDFHQLRPAGECTDEDCAGSRLHATEEERAALRDVLSDLGGQA